MVPRWVKVFGAIAVVVVVLVIVLLVVGGDHGPGRHTRSDGHAASVVHLAVTASGRR